MHIYSKKNLSGGFTALEGWNNDITNYILLKICLKFYMTTEHIFLTTNNVGLPVCFATVFPTILFDVLHNFISKSFAI